jgi:hypothetical protein
MARKTKEAPTEVRHAITGPEIDHDKLIGKIDKWNGEDRARASTAAETRSEIGDFTERTGMNPKALSMLRTIKKAAMKDGGQAKAMDIIRSLEAGLSMVKADISGQQSEMDLGQKPDDPVTEAIEPEEAPVLTRPTYGDDGHLGDPELAEKAVAFEDHLAEVAAQ